ncbi:MAG: glycerol-3-phosphate acyltransferase [Candidatus Heimdallarchaeaceae archaeon]|jgi:glycerol-3-phosphate acyltransferase PlsY
MASIDLLWAAGIGYLLGSIPFAFLVVKIFLGIDIRTVGSKNVGGRNVTRAFQAEGKPSGLAYGMGIVVAILDMLKGYFAMWLTFYLSFAFANADPWVICVAGPCAILGHNWPVWLLGPGGKGVASTLGSMMFFNPIFILVWLVLYFLLGSVIMYSAIAYIVSFVLMAVILIFWPWFVATPIQMFVDPQTLEILGWIGFATMLAITVVVLTRQGENFAKIRTGEAKKMKLYKIFFGKAEEALK